MCLGHLILCGPFFAASCLALGLVPVWRLELRSLSFIEGSKKMEMSRDRAFEINGLVVQAWLVREGLSDKDVPDLSSVSLVEAITASRIVAETPGERLENGSTRLTCHVDPTRIPQLYSWAIVTTSLARICQEHHRQ